MKNGFTLVELSIVLVIIGFLIGGILVGQSLIDSAKINQAVRQIQQYDIAVAQFQNKFSQMPGDSTILYPRGNNDGDIADEVAGTTISDCSASPCTEKFSFWKHLSDGGLLNAEYTFAPSDSSRVGVSSPAFYDSFLQIHNNADPVISTVTGWFFTSDFVLNHSDALAFDNKLDDKVLNTGNTVFRGASQGPDFGFGPTNLIGLCENTSDSCSVSQAVLSTSG